jgi:deoxyribonuclease V
VIIALDCHYTSREATAAACAIVEWTAGEIMARHRIVDVVPAEYQAGSFYRRELPLLLRVLAEIDRPIAALLIDAYVDLAPDKPGLGRHLVETLQTTLPVVGVAKTRYMGASHALEVRRGRSAKPLLITAANVAVEQAAAWVHDMHGAHRIPTLLREVDHLARGRS